MKALMICLLSFVVMTSYAVQDSKQLSDQAIDRLYAQLNAESLTMSQRLQTISRHFLGLPYFLGPLGEGDDARFDQSPLYRTDMFDCLTFVETVLALALANDAKQFQIYMRNIRYSEGQVNFIYRNHFTDVDWNINNQHQGFFKDITTLITNQDHQPVFQIASAMIDKPSWYQHLTPQQIKLKNSNPDEQASRLIELKKLGSSLSQVKAETPYIPLSVLFDKEGTVNSYIIAQIPDASIIEIVRPNWDLTEQIGTHLNISHLGFAFWINGQLIFRQASSIANKVIDTPLIDYLYNTLSSPTIKGINIQQLSPKAP